MPPGIIRGSSSLYLVGECPSFVTGTTLLVDEGGLAG